MTVTELHPGDTAFDPAFEPEFAPLARLRDRGRALSNWVALRRTDLSIMFGLLVVCGLVHGIGFDGYPGRINDDEGTYVAQAYAMEFRHSIAHYTYTYDHPFGGWLLMAASFTVTGALHWTSTAVTAGRLVMLVVHLVSCLLMYGLARRLGIGRVASTAAVLLFSLSPLAVFYQRMAFLDNIAVMWLLAALYTAASSRRSVASALTTGAFLAAAIWSKETVAFLLPCVYWLLRQHSDDRNRRLAMPAFWSALVGGVSVYILYAITKGEFLPGPGHVSLVSSAAWQLFERPSSGSVFDNTSGAYGLFMQWVHSDYLLFVVGSLAAVPAFAVRRLRPIALAGALQIIMLMRGGYLPYAYVTAMLPFAALALAGVVDAAWRADHSYLPRRLARSTKRVPTAEASVEVDHEVAQPGARPSMTARTVSRTAALLVTVTIMVLAAVSWPSKLVHAMTTDDSAGSAQATQWFLDHEPRNSVVLTDDNIWTDLVLRGQTAEPIWLFKLDLDPAVKARVGGWQGIDYAILGPLTPTDLRALPTVALVLDHSVVVKSFSNGYSIRKVVKP
jgi:hypothetical protein